MATDHTKLLYRNYAYALDPKLLVFVLKWTPNFPYFRLFGGAVEPQFPEFQMALCLRWRMMPYQAQRCLCKNPKCMEQAVSSRWSAHALVRSQASAELPSSNTCSSAASFQNLVSVKARISLVLNDLVEFWFWRYQLRQSISVITVSSRDRQ